MNLLPGELVDPGNNTKVKLRNGGIALSAYRSTHADRGAKVNVGIRPEDFVETNEDHAFVGKVDITEARGEVTLLNFATKSDADPVIAKLLGIHAELGHTEVRLTADPSKVHIFMNGASLLYR